MSFDADQAQRFFFVHLQKTAGLALRRRLIHHFGGTAVYPTRDLDGSDTLALYISVDRLRERLEVRGDQIQVITGHFPLRTVDELDGRFTTLTLLREPVERMLSYLRHRRENDQDFRLESLEKIYDAHYGQADNYMTRMLALARAEMPKSLFAPVELNREHLERAKEGLAGVHAVGLQERFEEFCADLTARYGWDLGGPEVINRSAPSEVSDGFRARIAENNALDIELYEFAEGLVDAKLD
jgi:hypothetical protein